MLRLFAAAREAAGTGREEVADGTVGEILAAARDRHGARFAAVLDASRVWVNGVPANDDAMATGQDEVAVLPPVCVG